jgi:hypothetical protein
MSQEVKTVDLNKLFRFELKFFKVLFKISKFTKVYLNVPEMVVLGFGFESPTLICSDYRSGEIIVKENLTTEAINACFELFAASSNEGVPIALWKVSESSTFRDRCRVLYTYEECSFNWNFSQTKGTSQIIQRFIRAPTISVIKSEYSLNSKVKTFIARKKVSKTQSKTALLKKNLGRTKFLLVNSDNYEKVPVSVSSVDHKIVYLVYLIEKYFIKEYNIKISQLRCNWIQDVTGKVYLLNLKEYKIASNFLSRFQKQGINLSSSLPTLNYVKKIKEAQERTSMSFLNLSTSSIWRDV